MSQSEAARSVYELNRSRVPFRLFVYLIRPYTLRSPVFCAIFDEHRLGCAHSFYRLSVVADATAVSPILSNCNSLFDFSISTLLFYSPSIYRHHVFAFQMYPVGMSDMRLIDSKVSTTWCQRQLVKSNSTFNAFLMPETPKVATVRQPVSMTR